MKDFVECCARHALKNSMGVSATKPRPMIYVLCMFIHILVYIQCVYYIVYIYSIRVCNCIVHQIYLKVVIRCTFGCLLYSTLYTPCVFIAFFIHMYRLSLTPPTPSPDHLSFYYQKITTTTDTSNIHRDPFFSISLHFLVFFLSDCNLLNDLMLLANCMYIVHVMAILEYNAE